jgi:hypothetical protein
MEIAWRNGARNETSFRKVDESIRRGDDQLLKIIHGIFPVDLIEVL